MGVEDETSRWEEMSRRQPPRLGSPAFTAWGDNPSARPGNEGEGVARGSGAAQQQEYMERLAGWHSSVNPQGLRDQLGGLRPAAARPTAPSKNPYQHVQSKLTGYLHGEEVAPQPRHKSSLQRRDGRRQSDRRASTKRPPRDATTSPPPSPTVAAMPQSQLRERIAELQKELSMGQSALAEYLETHGRSAEFDSFSREVDRLAQKLEEMEARADANERMEQSAQRRGVSPSAAESIPRLSPVRLSVDCPDGTAAGETVLVETEWGEELEVTVPEGIGPGQAFEFTVQMPVPQSKSALQHGTNVHGDTADRFEIATPPIQSSPPLQPERKSAPESTGQERGAAVFTAPTVRDGSSVRADAPEEGTPATRRASSTSVLETEIKQLRAELSQARLEVESERAHSATAMVDMERRLASEREIAQEQMLDAKAAARRQVESVQKAVQELQGHLANERTARRFAEKDAERQRKDVEAHRKKLRRIGLADCAAWACVHEEIVKLVEMERVTAVMAAEEAAEECEKAEEECEMAESELRSAELEWAAKEASFRQALAEADARAHAAAAMAAEAEEAARQAQQAAAEQAAAAEDAARKLEKEQRNAVRARTAKSTQAWQEKQRAASGSSGGSTRPAAPGSARERRHENESEQASSNRASPETSMDANANSDGAGQPVSAPRSSPGRARAPLPSFKVVQPAPVRSRPSHTSAKIGFLKAGAVITPLEKNWGLKGETWLRCECPAIDDPSGVRKIHGWGAHAKPTLFQILW